MDDTQALVFDIGSFNARAGIAGDDAPQLNMQSVVGRPKHAAAMVGVGLSDAYVGNMALTKLDMVRLVSPVKNGAIEHLDDYERMLHHIYEQELRLDPKERPTLFSVPLRSPLQNEQKTSQIMFESFGVPAYAGALAPMLSLYASGRNVGVVVEVGHGVLQIAPFYETSMIEEATIRLNIGGETMTQYMAKMLTERSPGMVDLTTSQYFMVDKLKRETAMVALDFDTAMQDFASSSMNTIEYQFENKTIHRLNNERIRCGEVLFQPKLLGIDSPGLSQLIYQAIIKSPIDIRKDLFNNIILSGGTTFTPGFKERIMHDLSALVPATTRVNIVAPPERHSSTWIGGSIIASLSSFQSLWFSKAEYEEHGPLHAHRWGCLPKLK